MVRGRGNVLLVLGVVPFAGAALTSLVALGLFDAISDSPVPRLLTYAPLALTAVVAAWLAHRRGASRWAPLWGLAGGGATIVFLLVIFAVLIALSGDDTGCPDGRIYC
jgi:hypothetical protein